MPVLARLHLSAETEIGRHASQGSVIISREKDTPRVAADSELTVLRSRRELSAVVDMTLKN